MLRDYVYISRGKLSTYWPQVCRSNFLKKEAQNVKAELGFNLGGVTGKVAVEQLPIESAVPLCELVEAFIRKNEGPGDIDSGARWVSGELSVRYVHLNENDEIFAFVGNYHDTAILFVGSRAYVNTNQSSQPARAGFSHTPFVEQELFSSWLKEFETMKEKELRIIHQLSGIDSTDPDDPPVGKFELACYVSELVRQASRSPFRVSVLARRLFFAPNVAANRESKNIAIYTPLYVAAS